MGDAGVSGDQRIITNEADVAEGAAWLAQRDPVLGQAIAQCQPLPLRLRPAGFSGLVDIIISQQVSVASAQAIRQRLSAAGFLQADTVIDAGEDQLRRAGLSRPKARYVYALARSGFDFDALVHSPDDTVLTRLTALLGIGPWTAQIYAMFCLGRPDVFPPGDLALQEAVRALYNLPERPSAAALDAMAERWSPWRSVAARALFAYYRVLKNREGLR